MHVFIGVGANEVDLANRLTRRPMQITLSHKDYKKTYKFLYSPIMIATTIEHISRSILLLWICIHIEINFKLWEVRKANGTENMSQWLQTS